MAKRIDVQLAFRADTTAAKNSIKDLQQSLSNLATQSIPSNATGKLASDMTKAQQTAVKLKIAINQALNPETGKLDFSQLSRSFKKLGLDVKTVGQEFSSWGLQGAQAFSQLTQHIQNTTIKLHPLQGLLGKLGTTLKNTIRWQISTAAIQAVTSSIRETISYAKDLNKSLNDIRIVTNSSTEYMSRFAEQANKAAKELRTTTLEYTKASLIYYQQGLTGNEVKERTDATVKLANVTGKSAQEVSEWTTAIWNNFDNGKKSLEYYLDVITKLGAATASSADEIAGGLEKFAAVADTVGLSYEYATSALATITAQTRQSEDVVGTALKTIFARMESLKLGEKLEDGTDLGQYADNLMKIGVNIKDASGELKDMDTILQAVGNKWKTLGKDEQVALAQGVAGVRQYSQFIALMDNWDQVEKNATLAKNSAGSLNSQAKIFEEGVTGASNKLTASLESLKNTLLDENQLLPFLNILTKIVEGVEFVVETLGGLPGILLLTANIFRGQIIPAMARGVTKGKELAVDTWGGITGKTSKDRAKMVNTATQTNTEINKKLKDDTQTSGLNIQFTKEEEEITKRLLDLENQLSEEEKEQINLLRQIVELKRQAALRTAEDIDATDKENAEGYETVTRDGNMSNDPETKSGKKEKTDNQNQNQNQNNQNQNNQNNQNQNNQNQNNQNQNQNNQNQNQNQPNTSAATVSLSEKEYADIERAHSFDDRAEQFAKKRRVYSSDNMVKEATGFIEEAKTAVGENPTDGQKMAIANMEANKESLEKDTATFRENKNQIKANKDQIKSGKLDLEQKKKLQKENRDLSNSNKTLSTNIKKTTKSFADNAKQVKVADTVIGRLKKSHPGLEKALDKLSKGYKTNSKNTKTFNRNLSDVENATKNVKKTIADLESSGAGFGKAFQNIGTGLMSLTMSANMCQSAVTSMFQAFSDPEATLSDKISAFLQMGMTLGYALDSINKVKSAFTSFSEAIQLKKLKTQEANLEEEKSIMLANQEQVENIESANTQRQETQATQEGTQATQAEAVAQEAETSTDVADVAMTGAVLGADAKERASDIQNTSTNVAEGVSESVAQGAKLPFPANIGAMIASVATVFALLGAVGITAGSAASTKATAAEKSRTTEQTTEEAKEAQEKYSENKEKKEDFTTAYKDYQKTGEGLQSLREKALEVAKAYDIAGGEALALKGDFESLSKAVKDAEKAELENTIEKTENAVNAAKDEWLYNVSPSGAPTSSDLGEKGWGKGDERVLSKAIEKTSLASKVIYGDDSGKVVFDSAELAKMSAEETAQAMVEIQNALQKDGVDREGELYKYLQEILQKGGAESLVSESEKLLGYSGESEAIDDSEKGIKDWNAARDLRKKAGKMNALKRASYEEEIKENDVNGLYVIADAIADKAGDSKEFTTDELWDAIEEKGNGVISKKWLDAVIGVSIGENTTKEWLINAAEKSIVSTSQSGARVAGGKLEKTSEEVEGLVSALSQLHPELKDDEDILYNMAENSYNMSYNLKDAFTQWDEIGEDFLNPQNPYEYGEAVGSITNGLKTAFNFSSDDYDKQLSSYISSHKTLMSQFFSGDANAVKQVYADIAGIVDGASQDATDVQSAIDQIITDFRNGGEGKLDIKLTDEIVTAMNDPESALSKILKMLGYVQDKNGKIVMALDVSAGIKDNVADVAKSQEDKSKEFEKNRDYLFEEKETVDSIKQSYDEISAAKDRAYGQDKIDLSNKLISNLEEEANINDKIIAKNKELAEGKKDALISTYGAKFDDNGNMTNYEEIEKQLADNVIANAGSAGEEAAQDAYDDFVDMYKKYSEYDDDTKTREERNLEIAEEKSNELKEQREYYRNLENDLDVLDKEYDKLSEEVKIVDNLTASYEKLSAAKERAYGSDKITISEQIQGNFQLQKQNYENLAKKSKKAADEAEEELRTEWGATFDSNGNVSNKEEIEKKIRDKIKAAKLSGDTEQQEIWEDNLDEFLGDTDRYYEKVDEANTYTLNAFEATTKEIEERLETIDYVLNLQLEVSDEEIEDIERKIQLLEYDTNYDIAEMATLMSTKSGEKATSAQAYLNSANDILRKAGASEAIIEKINAGDGQALADLNLSDEELEKYKSYINSAKDSALEANDIIYQGTEILTQKYEALFQKLENAQSKIDGYKSQLSSMKNIADLIGISSENLRNVSASLRKGQEAAAQAATANAKAKYDGLVKEKSDIEAEMKSITDKLASGELTQEQADVLTAQLQAQLDTIEAELPDALGNLYATVGEEIQANIDGFKEMVKDTLEETSEEIWGMTSSELKTKYDRQKEIKDLYLTEFEKTYQLNKLTRSIQAEIDKTDNVVAQKKYNNLLETTNGYYADGIKLSEGQLGVLEKEFKTMQALIALEEGRNAKSKVQLQKNALGGYSYVYTADQEQVSKLEQAYEDSLYQYESALSKMVEDSESAIITIYTKWEEALNNLDVTAEDYQEQWNAVNAHYTELIEFHTGQIDWSLQECNRYVSENKEHIEQSFGDLSQFLKQDWLTNFKDTFIGTTTNLSSATGILTTFKDKIGSVENETSITGSVIKSFKAMQNKINTILVTKIGASVDEFATHIDTKVGNKDTDNTIVGELYNVEEEVGKVSQSFDDLTKWDLTDWASGISQSLSSIQANALAAANALTAFAGIEMENIEKQKDHDLFASDELDVDDYAAGKVFTIGANRYAFTGSLDEATNSGDFTGSVLDNSIQVTATGRVGVKRTSSGGYIQVFEGKDSNGNLAWYNKDGAKVVEETPADTKVNSNFEQYKTINNELLSKSFMVKAKTNAFEVEGIDINNSDYTGIATSTGELSKDTKLTLSGKYGVYTKKDGTLINLVQATDGKWYNYDRMELVQEEEETDTNTSTQTTSSTSPQITINTTGSTQSPYVDKKVSFTYKKRDFEDAASHQALYWGIFYYGGKWYKYSLSKAEYDGNTWNKTISFDVSSKTPQDVYETTDPKLTEKDNEIPYKDDYGIDTNDSDDNYYEFKTNWAPKQLKEKSSNKIYNQLQHQKIKGQEVWTDYNKNEDKIGDKDKNGFRIYKYKRNTHKIYSFDTGGYTGSWGPEGKIAMLHQKEIVLNASDTSNFLEAIKLIRQIASHIDLQAASMSAGSFINALSMINVSGPSDTLDQNVTIHAEFPNVTQHTEIEQAFENLVNKASQFANRK